MTESVTSDTTPPRPRSITILGFTWEWPALRTVLATFLFTRLMIIIVILFSSTVIPMRPNAPLYATPDNIVIDGLVRFDSWWYHNIITQGYSMGDVATGQQGNVAFFPLYPLLTKMMMGLTGDVFWAGIIVSNVTFLLALGYLYALTRTEADEATAVRTLFYFAAAPTAVFFSAMYTESLYLLLVIATFYYAHQANWNKAALAGILAAATRNTGILLTAVIALEALHQQGFRFWPATWTRQPASWQFSALLPHFRQQLSLIWPARTGIVASLFVPMGLVGYMAYLANTFGDPLGFIHVQETWGRTVSSTGFLQLISNTRETLNIQNIWLGQFNPVAMLDFFATLGFGILIVGVLCHMRPAHIIFVGLTFLVPLSTGTMASMSRYILMLVPCFIVLGQWASRPQLDRAISTIFPVFMCYTAVLFSHWYFAG